LSLDKNGNIISSGKEAEKQGFFSVEFYDKTVDVSPIKNKIISEKSTTKQKDKKDKNSQGDLFGG
jgi:hypothetical protein